MLGILWDSWLKICLRITITIFHWPAIPISGVTILLSLTVFSQVLADTMPATSDAIPLLGNSLLRAGHCYIHPPMPLPNFMYAKQPHYQCMDKLNEYRS